MQLLWATMICASRVYPSPICLPARIPQAYRDHRAAYSGPAARFFCWTRTAAAAQLAIATTISRSRSHPKLSGLWDATTWVAFPLAAWDTCLTCIKTSKRRGMPPTAAPIAMPVSSVRRLPGFAGFVRGVLARRLPHARLSPCRPSQGTMPLPRRCTRGQVPGAPRRRRASPAATTANQSYEQGGCVNPD
jgi:hypothetical protein